MDDMNDWLNYIEYYPFVYSLKSNMAYAQAFTNVCQFSPRRVREIVLKGERVASDVQPFVQMIKGKEGKQYPLIHVLLYSYLT